MKNLFVYFFMIMVLTGCTNSVEKVEITEEQQVIPQSVEAPALKYSKAESIVINGQEIEIIPYYEQYLNYVLQQKETSGNKEAMFSESVIKEISNDIYGNEYYFQEDLHFITPRNTDRLEEYVMQLDDQHEEIKEWIKEGFEDSSTLFSGSDYKVYIIPFTPDISSSDMEGAAGFATDQKAMVLQLDPTTFTEQSLKQLIAHEYHHLVYMEKSDYKSRKHHLMDYVIMEGKADSFAGLVYPGYDVGWIQPLSELEAEAVWSYLDEHQNSYDSEHYYTLRAGIAGRGIPKWALYRIGYQLMQDFIGENPEMTVEEWSVVKAVDILEQREGR